VRGFLTICVLGALAGCSSIVPTADNPPPAIASEWALDARIEVATFDRTLLALAIFHETNRVRSQLGLTPFSYLPKLNEAADLEAAVGKVYQPPSHTNPFPMIGTPMQRVIHVGLDPGLVAENIALLSIYEVAIDVGAGVVLREGRRRVVNPQTLEELRPATYRGFATTLVRAWMNSPGHRVNIVNPELRYVGCSVQPSVSILGLDQLFCVQVFYTRRN
jgi:uncharacterized protein YkwD